MAVTSIDLEARDAAVYRFPSKKLGRRRALARQRVVRRRLSLGVVAAGLVLATVFGGGPNGTAAAGRGKVPASVAFGPGDTLWALAERYAAPSVDRRAYVDAIIRLNDLGGATLEAGTRLLLPR